MIDQFEKSAVQFTTPLAVMIKNQIRSQIGGLQGSLEHRDGYDRAQFLLHANVLTGLELKALKHYIDNLPRNAEGKITDPAYYLIGGNYLATFVMQEMQKLRDQINRAEANQKELGKTEKQDTHAPKPPETEEVTGLPKLGLAITDRLAEQVNRIKKLIVY